MIWRRLMFVALTMLLAACGGERSDPEQQIRALIGQAETAAEQRDAGTLKDMIGAQYRDGRGWDRHQVAALVHAVLLRHRNIHLFTVIHAVEVIEPTQARAEVLVAMTGKRVRSAEELAGLRADLWRFDVWFRLTDDTWQVVRADWQPARLDQFLF